MGAQRSRRVDKVERTVFIVMVDVEVWFVVYEMLWARQRIERMGGVEGR